MKDAESDKDGPVLTGVAGDTELQSFVLEDLSDAVNYRRWLADLARPHLGDHPIEAGSGLGDYALEWLPDVARITVTEGDEDRLGTLRARFTGDDRVAVRSLMLPVAETADHSAFVALNVLEHIEDDVAALRSAGGLLRPGGKVVLIVPAFPSAMSAFDRRIGHFRRYTVESMRAVLTGAGLTIETVRYVNPLGLLAWYVLMKGLRRTPANGPMLRVYDRFVVPALRRVDGRSPFGQSVFAVARTSKG